ncbi:hypothetical protein BCD48_42040 [Pseudofrankia sp. BMG5.36]|nr:hypothetical protein BCD48_42040 [Pseudofrankia sp. BMG5.36]
MQLVRIAQPEKDIGQFLVSPGTSVQVGLWSYYLNRRREIVLLSQKLNQTVFRVSVTRFSAGTQLVNMTFGGQTFCQQSGRSVIARVDVGT